MYKTEKSGFQKVFLNLVFLALISFLSASEDNIRIVEKELDESDVPLAQTPLGEAKFQGIHIGGANRPMQYWPLIKIDRILFDTSGLLKIDEIVLIWYAPDEICLRSGPVKFEVPPIGSRVEVFGRVWGYASGNGRYRTIYMCGKDYYMIAIDHKPSGCPDLMMQDIWVEPSSFAPGQRVTIRFRAKNAGNTDAGAFKIALIFDGREIGFARLNGLAAGKTIEGYKENFIWPIDTNCHRIKVILDLDNVVQECDELNNVLTKSFCPSARQGSLTIFDLDYKGNPPNSDGNNQHFIVVSPGSTLKLFFRYQEGNTGNPYIIRAYPEWDKTRFIVNSDNDESVSEVGYEIGGYRWDVEHFVVPVIPGTYRIKLVYNQSASPPTWDSYDKLLAEGLIKVQQEEVWAVFINGYPSTALYAACIRIGERWQTSPEIKQLKIEGIASSCVFGNLDVSQHGDKIIFSVKEGNNWNVYIGDLDIDKLSIYNAQRIFLDSDGRGRRILGFLGMPQKSC
ncbi:MAG: CARDB domain-containing protein [Candidatus Bipolaricaulaceae bacterium]